MLLSGPTGSWLGNGGPHLHLIGPVVGEVAAVPRDGDDLPLVGVVDGAGSRHVPIVLRDHSRV